MATEADLTATVIEEKFDEQVSGDFLASYRPVDAANRWKVEYAVPTESGTQRRSQQVDDVDAATLRQRVVDLAVTLVEARQAASQAEQAVQQRVQALITG